MVVGGGGFLGTCLAERASTSGFDAVHSLVRVARPPTTAVERVHLGDARSRDLGLAPDVAAELSEGLTHLVLTVGAVDFGLSIAQARSQHLSPLAGALSFAAGCTSLERVVYVSSVLAVGEAGGLLRSSAVPTRPRFRNIYEWAKFEGERLCRRSGLPVRVIRPGQIFNSVDDRHRTRRPVGIFAALPALASVWPTPVDGGAPYWMGPVDFVADIALRMACDDASPETVWAVDPRSPTLAEVLDVLAARHGLPARRLGGRLFRWTGSVLDPRWFDLDVSSEIARYAATRFELDLSCIQELLSRVPSVLPDDLGYVDRTFEHEVRRFTEFAYQ